MCGVPTFCEKSIVKVGTGRKAYRKAKSRSWAIAANRDPEFYEAVNQLIEVHFGFAV